MMTPVNIYRTGPVTTDLDGVLAIARCAGRPLTVDEAETALSRVGRVNGPALLFDLYYSGCLTADMLPALVVGVWSAAEWPSGNLPRSTWINWFRKAAYPPPSGPLVIYRGAIPQHARGMAWTTDRQRAEWFANRWAGAHVYTVTAEPAAVLADVDAIEGDGGRRECEIVVDPAMLGRLRRL
jgi:hypothetical protein